MNHGHVRDQNSFSASALDTWIFGIRVLRITVATPAKRPPFKPPPLKANLHRYRYDPKLVRDIYPYFRCTAPGGMKWPITTKVPLYAWKSESGRIRGQEQASASTALRS
jgi:hypothetical protein